jgi:putative hemin transport protein
MLSTSSDLASRWQALAARQPSLRIYDAARLLGEPEAALLQVEPGSDVTRLVCDWAALLPAVGDLGRVMALTRNASCVHERHGQYLNVEADGPVGLALGEDIDLRLFLRQWAHGFAVRPEAGGRRRPSLQFFDAAGRAVHKIFCTGETDMAAYDAFVARFAAPDGAAPADFEAPKPAKRDRPDSEIDVEGLRAAWNALRDTHDFFGMLRKFGAGRVQAMRLAGPELARPLGTGAVRRALETASRTKLAIMVFVGNEGCIQIHSGPVDRLKQTGDWFNVLDPAFNLHLKETDIASVWLVRKPTADGIVTSLEVFDAAGATIATLFGKRKPGVPENLRWRALVDEVAAAEAN